MRKGGSIPDVQILTSLVHTVPVYAPVRPGSLQPADQSETGRIWDGNLSAFIYFRQCYGQGPVWVINWSRYVAVMLWFATVHSRCRSGGATVCPGASRYTTVLPRESAAEPRWQCGGSRKKNSKAPVLHSRYIKGTAMWVGEKTAMA